MATVVFDGYNGGPSIKHNTHQRRLGQKVHPVVSFTAETLFSGRKEEFLSRDINKQALIDLISGKLEERGCVVINSPGNADIDITKAAVEASQFHTTTLIGEDTDLLILLLHYAQTDSRDLYFRSDKSAATTVYHINSLKSVLGNKLCSQLLFIHAFTGCDSTSRIFGVGKRAAFQKLAKGNSVLKSCADQFLSPNQEKKVIEHIGSKVMAVLFGGKGEESLTSLRHITLSKKIVSSKSFVAPRTSTPQQSLPPDFILSEFIIS